MFCRNCGKQIADQAVFCVSCGCAPLAGQNHCHHCGEPSQPGAAVCIKCGVGFAKPVPPDAKSKLVAGLLGILLGSLGIHRFYLGYIGIGIAQIAVTLVTCGLGGIWGLIEGILILVGNMNTDAQGRPLKE